MIYDQIIRVNFKNMKRFIDLRLKEWVISHRRKPFLLRGARQVGKTFAVRKLAKTFKSYIEINFEQQPHLKSIFDHDFIPTRIIRDISAALNKKIIPGETLLFFDEIQEAPRAITSLRYFYEDMPNLHVIAAGSLLDFALDQVGAPVGRLSSFFLYPMSWIEYLQALNEEILLEAILNHNPNEPMNAAVHDKALRLLSEYLAIGGMPEAVRVWIETHDPNAFLEIHQNIITFYKQDFQKYSEKRNVKYVESVFANVPNQLGSRYKFNLVPGEYRKRELYPALNLLEKAGVIHKVYHSPGHGIPLGAAADMDKFKVVFLDVGLTQALLGLNSVEWFLNPNQSFINKGALVESFVGQELLAYSNPILENKLYYWQREARSSQAEVDYLIQKQTNIIPIEVKSDHGSTLRSMHLFLETHPESPYGIRYSAHNYSIHRKIKSIPLYAISSLLNEKV